MMTRINILVKQKKPISKAVFNNIFYDTNQFFEKYGVTLNFEWEDHNTGYHIYLEVSKSTREHLLAGAAINRKKDGIYKVHYAYGGLRDKKGLVYGRSHEEVMIHEILHCFFQEVGMGDIHDYYENGHYFGRADNERVMALSLARMRNNPTQTIVHHTTDKSRRWQYEKTRKYHVSKNWGDIGYHWFIEKDGSLKVGRWDGLEGAHTIGHNRNSVGIVLAGNFEEQEPTKAQLVALDKLLSRLSMPVFGHRDFAATACPGKNLYYLLNAGQKDMFRIIKASEQSKKRWLIVNDKYRFWILDPPTMIHGTDKMWESKVEIENPEQYEYAGSIFISKTDDPLNG